MPILLYSYSWFIYNFVILFLLFLVCVNKKIKKSSYFIIFVFFIIFSVYGYITADYNSYLELMKMSKVNDPLADGNAQQDRKGCADEIILFLG